MKKYRQKPFFRALQNYVTFFLLVAFIVSCSTMLFVSVMRESMGLVLTKENMETAAKLTFGNVLLISFGAATIDYIRRKRMVDKPVKQIMDALDQVMQGDFTVRIAHVKEFAGETGFNEVINGYLHDPSGKPGNQAITGERKWKISLLNIPILPRSRKKWKRFAKSTFLRKKIKWSSFASSMQSLPRRRRQHRWLLVLSVRSLWVPV